MCETFSENVAASIYCSSGAQYVCTSKMVVFFHLSFSLLLFFYYRKECKCFINLLFDLRKDKKERKCWQRV